MRKTSRSRVLVVEDVELEAKLLTRALADAGYSNIVHKHDVPSAIAEIQANPPRIVITDLRLDDSTGIELTKFIRTLESTNGYVYVIMLTSSGSDAALGACFEAGVDDFVVKPFRSEAIVSRMRAGERILALETSLRTKSRELETALRRIDIAAAQRALAKAAELQSSPAEGATPLDALLGTDTWRDIESHLNKAMGEFFQLPFAPCRSRDDRKEPFVAEVSLSDPSKELELGLSVVVDTESMKRLGAVLLGDEDLESAQALVLEVANILMGTLKTAFTANAFNFTGSIPSEEVFATSRSLFDRAQVRSRMALSAGENDLELWLRVKEKNNTSIRGRDLKEGLVIGEDIRDERGMLLIKGGSRLTQTAAERLARILPDVFITVSDPNK